MLYSACLTAHRALIHSRALDDRGVPLPLPHLSLALEQHAVGRQQRLDVLEVDALQRRRAQQRAPARAAAPRRGRLEVDLVARDRGGRRERVRARGANSELEGDSRAVRHPAAPLLRCTHRAAELLQVASRGEEAWTRRPRRGRRQLQREGLRGARPDVRVANEAGRAGRDGVVRPAHDERRAIDGARHVEGVVEQRRLAGCEPWHIGLIVAFGVGVVPHAVASVARRELTQRSGRHHEAAAPQAALKARGLGRADLLRASEARARPRAADRHGGLHAVERRCCGGKRREGDGRAVEGHGAHVDRAVRQDDRELCSGTYLGNDGREG
eukprot:scaffold4287_cov65-Phaeocystis_antarctica.AAC.11